jgi:NAD(P)H-flavin reductase
MVFEAENELTMKPGQFITFLVEKIWWRAYSILKLDWKRIILIIKKRELDEWWRWWSKIICELNVWESLRWVWPAGHFLLRESNNNKLFIWTWTGLVPLYNMINFELKNNNNTKIKFIFWVRVEEDIFYINELEKLKSKYQNFEYYIYISRVKDLYKFKLNHNENIINSWYTTNYLSLKNIKNYQEVYICWAHTMIESTVEKLKNLNFKENENIFYEKY